MELDTVKANVKFIKESYPKKVRMELVTNLIEAQANKNDEVVENISNLLDQIFSVLLKNLKWSMAESLKDWDYRPIDIMKEAFPKIEKTKWYDMRHKQLIDQLNKIKG
ncbi:MAG: hypothetical protein U9R50_07585 [Campylobacterota bacterium]|nr:hypothetical protein [Campylobacterota bacterium]